MSSWKRNNDLIKSKSKTNRTGDYCDMRNNLVLLSLLASAFSLNGLDYKKRSIILSNYSRHYAFCKTNAFDFAKTSAFLSIMHVLLERDTRLHTDEIDMFRSCDYFEELLLTHSVERSPVR